jgi:hypothetical protein
MIRNVGNAQRTETGPRAARQVRNQYCEHHLSVPSLLHRPRSRPSRSAPRVPSWRYSSVAVTEPPFLGPIFLSHAHRVPNHHDGVRQLLSPPHPSISRYALRYTSTIHAWFAPGAAIPTTYEVQTDAVLQALIAAAAADPAVLGLVLTGSRAVGAVAPDSDYDLIFVVTAAALARYQQTHTAPCRRRR